MQALWGITISVVTRKLLRLYCDSREKPPLITPGKYRPLEHSEIYAAVKESTPPYDDSANPSVDVIAMTPSMSIWL